MHAAATWAAYRISTGTPLLTVAVRVRAYFPRRCCAARVRRGRDQHGIWEARLPAPECRDVACPAEEGSQQPIAAAIPPRDFAAGANGVGGR